MMSKEKQIEELSEIFRKVCDATPNGKCISKLCCACRAETVIRAGYRKQEDGEWISVEERLPEPYTWVTVYNPNGKYTKIDTDEIVGGNWVRNCGKVTHWMPLPEPPDMKEV